MWDYAIRQHQYGHPWPLHASPRNTPSTWLGALVHRGNVGLGFSRVADHHGCVMGVSLGNSENLVPSVEVGSAFQTHRVVDARLSKPFPAFARDVPAAKEWVPTPDRCPSDKISGEYRSEVRVRSRAPYLPARGLRQATLVSSHRLPAPPR